jgi:(p)ppGpp synthase/HD superfamily hydrolase
VITAPGAKPNPVWLDFVVTGKARSNIRHFLKHLHEDEAIGLGQRMLDKALAANDMSWDKVPEEMVDKLLEQLNVKTREALYQDISLGNRVASLVARQIADISMGGQPREGAGVKGMFKRYAPDWLKSSPSRQGSKPLAIRGTEGSVVTFAKCCHPIPGDPILGFVSAGRGIVVHLRGCKNIREFRNNPERWVDLQWEKDVQGTYPVEVRVDTENQRGVLATVAAVISDLESNIENVSIDERDGRFSSLLFTLSVKDRVHLANIIRRVRALDSVVRITRSK